MGVNICLVWQMLLLLLLIHHVTSSSYMPTCLRNFCYYGVSHQYVLESETPIRIYYVLSLPQTIAYSSYHYRPSETHKVIVLISRTCGFSIYQHLCLGPIKVEPLLKNNRHAGAGISSFVARLSLSHRMTSKPHPSIPR